MTGAAPPLSTASSTSASADGQEFCLRWNNHQATIVSILEQQFRNEAFVDVTLAVDGLALRAHRMVLCACSPYFSSLLANTHDKHPIVILRDVAYEDMRALLDFMYRGEVSVSQDCLDRLLKVAESLRIRGLADVSEHNTTASQTLGNGRSRGLAREILESSHQQHHPVPVVAAATTAAALSVGALQGLHVIADAAASKRPLHLAKNANGISTTSGTPPPPPPPPLTERVVLRQTSTNSSARSPSSSISSVSAAVVAENVVGAGARSSIKGKRFRPRSTVAPSSAAPAAGAVAGTKVRVATASALLLPTTTTTSSRDGRFSATVEDLSTSAPRTSSSSLPVKDSYETPEKRIRVKQEPQESSETGIVVKTEPEDVVSLTEGSTPSSDVCCEPDIWMDSNGDGGDDDDDDDDSMEGADVLVSNGAVAGGPSSSSSAVTAAAGATLEYSVCGADGQVACKLCGEFLPSRMHWYRHKYRVHQVRVYACKRCNVAFKSKRGLDNHSVVKHRAAPSPRYQLCPDRVIADEERFVLDIIERVKKECRGTGVDLDRKGYNKHFSHLDASGGTCGGGGGEGLAGVPGTSSTGCGTSQELLDGSSNDNSSERDGESN